MILRVAKLTDIPAMREIRNAVKENKLSDPLRITEADYIPFIDNKGRSWVVETEAGLAGFASIDLSATQVWALFVHPEQEHKGVGRLLHAAMLDWYFGQTDHDIWLSTAPDTRAASFYLMMGWTRDGNFNNEHRYILRMQDYLGRKAVHPPLAFEGKRIVLRNLTLQDAPFLMRVMNTPKWIEYIGDRDVKTVEAAAQYMETRVYPQHQRLGYSNFVVIEKETGASMGVCGFFDRDGIEGIEIGYAFLPEFGGKGYAVEAARKVMEIGKHVFGIRTLKAITVKENVASQKILYRIGMNQIGTVDLGEEKGLLLFEGKTG